MHEGLNFKKILRQRQESSYHNIESGENTVLICEKCGDPVLYDDWHNCHEFSNYIKDQMHKIRELGHENELETFINSDLYKLYEAVMRQYGKGRVTVNKTIYEDLKESGIGAEPENGKREPETPDTGGQFHRQELEQMQAQELIEYIQNKSSSAGNQNIRRALSSEPPTYLPSIGSVGLNDCFGLDKMSDPESRERIFAYVGADIGHPYKVKDWYGEDRTIYLTKFDKVVIEVVGRFGEKYPTLHILDEQTWNDVQEWLNKK